MVVRVWYLIITSFERIVSYNNNATKDYLKNYNSEVTSQATSSGKWVRICEAESFLDTQIDKHFWVVTYR